VLEVAIQVPAVRRLTRGAHLSLDHRDRDVRDVLTRFFPVLIGRGVVQILIYVELFLASLLALGGVSGLTYAQVLYLLPISLFGMAVAAAELPELSRIGRSGAAAIRERLHDGMDRITFYVAITVAVYVFAGDVIVALLLQRGEFTAADTQLVWYVTATFALGLLATTRSRLLQNGLYALNRPKLVVRISITRVALAALIGAVLMFPLDRFAIEDGAVGQDGTLAFRALPDSLRLVDGGPPRLGIVGLAIGAAVSSWIEYALLRGALRWRIGALPGLSHASRWSLLAAAGAGVLAAGLRARTDDLSSVAAFVVVIGPTVAVYLLITTVMGVPEATALAHRARALLPGGRSGRQR
jgi:putative peptidoglycan lipid II flippase